MATHPRSTAPAAPPPVHSTISRALEEADSRILSREQCAAIIQQLVQTVRGTGETGIQLSTWWNGELRWARNGITTLSNRRDIELNVSRRIGGSYGQALTNQIDAISLEAVIRSAERRANEGAGVNFGDLYADPPVLTTPSPTIWSEATVSATVETRSKLAQLLVDGAEAKGMLSAGYLEIRGASKIRIDLDDRMIQQLQARSTGEAQKTSHDMMQYAAYTQAQCSMTVRHPRGTGSGWAGASGFDWAQIDAVTLAERALDKCVQSIDPVRIEPGRYTVVLEPQAVADLVDILMVDDTNGKRALDRIQAENGGGPFSLDMDPALELIRTRLGLRIIDERITIAHDPMDPQLGVLPMPGLAPITWIDRGVLRTLSYQRDYAVVDLHESTPALARLGYRMSGGTTTIREMIETTRRGLLVTRFSNLRMVELQTLLATGVTRDGLWLIENGRITKSVKNMRITESPLFVLNNLEQLGLPVPVFRPVRNPFDLQLSPALVPPLKANDFSFTSTVDAI